MNSKDKIQKHLFNLYAGIQRENEKKNILLECLHQYEPGTDEYKRTSSQIELITGNIGMLSAVVEQQLRRLEELTPEE